MKWQFCADVHGACDRLRDALDPDLPLALLGDNLNLVDFHTFSGVATRVLKKSDLARILLVLATGGPKKAQNLANRIFFENPERVAAARREITRDYAELASVLPASSVVLHGNVDWPDLLRQAVGERYIDVGKMEVGGVTIGFLSGTGPYPFSMGLPGEGDARAYTEKLWSLGPVDLLCTHFPPDIEGITWDRVARRSEGGGKMLNDYIMETKPRLHLFGHIHNPKVAESRLGETRLVNVGGFRYNGRIHVIDLETLE